MFSPISFRHHLLFISILRPISAFMVEIGPVLWLGWLFVFLSQKLMSVFRDSKNSKPSVRWLERRLLTGQIMPADSVRSIATGIVESRWP